MKLRLLLATLLRPWLWFRKPLAIEDLHPIPMVQFARWYRLAQRCFWLEFPDALCLATIDAAGQADSRIVLLKDFDISGLTFFTNYSSPKGRQIDARGEASMTFFWDALQQQVRIKGSIEKLTAEESDAYFKSRSRDSQIGAWASMQSEVLVKREELELRFQEIANKFKDVEVSRPEHWGGYRLKPVKLEFWQAQAHRLHDRFLYLKDAQGEWQISRLYP